MTQFGQASPSIEAGKFSNRLKYLDNNDKKSNTKPPPPPKKKKKKKKEKETPQKRKAYSKLN
jgi:hypothetical protein